MTPFTSDPRFFRDPYPFLARLRAAGPVQAVEEGRGRTSFVVTGYPEAREALADPRLSKDTAAFFAGRASKRNLHPAVSQSMIATDPPAHTRLRALLTKAFTPGAAERLRPFVGEVAGRLLDAWPERGRAELMAGLAVPLPVTVICELLGIPEEDRPRVHGWSADLFAAADPERTDAASHAVAGYLSGLVAERRQAPGDGLLDALIAVRDGGDRLSEDELVSLAVLLLVAGHETTANFLGNAVLALLANPEAGAAVAADPARIPAVLDELLRYDPPLALTTFRFAAEPLTLGGTEIPAGAPVLIAPGAANRDPRFCPEPDRLDLDRPRAETRGQLAFGHGIHRCLGAPLARAEAEVALTALFTRFPKVALAVPAEELNWRHTRLVRGLQALPLTLD